MIVNLALYPYKQRCHWGYDAETDSYLIPSDREILMTRHLERRVNFTSHYIYTAIKHKAGKSSIC